MPSNVTPQQHATAKALCSKMADLKRLMFDLKELRVDYTVYGLAALTDADWREFGATTDHLTQAVVTGYADAVDRVDAALGGTAIVPAMAPNSLPPIILFTRMARSGQ